MLIISMSQQENHRNNISHCWSNNKHPNKNTNSCHYHVYIPATKCNIIKFLKLYIMIKNTNGGITKRTYFGENTVHINKWFLIKSSMMVYATKSTEFNPSGTRQGNPRIVLRSCPMFFNLGFMSFIEIDNTMLRRDSIGDAYVITNIINPLSTVEWVEIP